MSCLWASACALLHATRHVWFGSCTPRPFGRGLPLVAGAGHGAEKKAKVVAAEKKASPRVGKGSGVPSE
eukprot:4850943-Lingulodinium_polyedra.AAC.1